MDVGRARWGPGGNMSIDMDPESFGKLLKHRAVRSAISDAVARGVVVAGLFLMVLAFACGLVMGGMRGL